MKYLDEVAMKGVRARLESEILTWPAVTSKEMMGCLCYFRGKKFFAFLVTDGLVITKLAEEDRAELSRRPGSKPFEMAGRTAAVWVQARVHTPKDLQPLLPYVRKSYEKAAP